MSNIQTQYFRCDECRELTTRPNWSDEGYRSNGVTYETGDTDGVTKGRFTMSEGTGTQVMIPLCKCGGRARALHGLVGAMLDIATPESP